MKRLPLYTAIIIGLVVLMMFFPYIIVYDGDLDHFSLEPFTYKGIEFIEVYVLLLGFVLIALFSTIKRNSTTALISVILTFGLGVLFLLNIDFITQKPIYYFIDFDWGFILHGLMVFVYFLLLLTNFVIEFGKKKKKRPASSSELLDNF